MDSDKLELLFKKNLGVPYAKPGDPYPAEYAVASRYHIVPDKQIYSDVIPGVAPTSLQESTSFDSSYGKKYTSTEYPHIKKYEKLILTSLAPLRSYRFNPTSDVPNNILQHAIPFNFDAGGSYRIIVYINDEEIPANHNSYPWVIDFDAGVLTFLNQLSSPVIVKISFWRYEGRFGFQVVASNAQKFIFDGGVPNTDFSSGTSALLSAGGPSG